MTNRTRVLVLVLAPPLAALIVVLGPLLLRAVPPASEPVSSRAMARFEGPALTMDLSDSTLAITVRGVRVREIRPSRWSVTGPLRNPALYLLQGASGTAPRVTIRPITAPADTAEFNKQRPPAPVSQAPITATLHYDRGLAVYLDPDSAGTADRVRGGLFRFAERVREAVAPWMHGTPATVSVAVRLDPADLRAVYRALEDGAPLAVLPNPPR